MIQSKSDLKTYLKFDYQANGVSKYEGKFSFVKRYTNVIDNLIWKYIKYLRISEYYKNTSVVANHTIWHRRLLYVLCKHKKNKLGSRLGIEIGENSFGYGLTIYHPNGIVVNEAAKIGNFCKLHGNNCIGNKGLIGENGCPRLGDNVDIGVGAKVLGSISIANNISIGANAVVLTSFDTENVVACGCPAVIKKRKI